MATYTLVSFYVAMGIAAIGLLFVLLIPRRRRVVFDALRHPLGGSDDDDAPDVVTVDGEAKEYVAHQGWAVAEPSHREYRPAPHA